jgi:predicted ATPase/DNA-binding CsgD family transcriptional regulator
MSTMAVPGPGRERPAPLIPLVRRPWFATPPSPLTPLIGREAELATALALVRRPGVRLVSLTGPGGIGKTRLALALAQAASEEFPDGVVWVPLATVRQREAVLPAIARALGTGDATSPSAAEAIRTAVRDDRILVVLDNVEQVVDAAPDLAALLSACPSLTLLVTSRARLRVSGEQVLPVPPLSLAAARLFAERASAVDQTFALTAETAPLVEEICRRLDGLPLAIELAAARVTHLALPALLARLDRRLPLLTGGGRDVPERQRTMRDAVAWSHDLLAPDEQRLFRRLSVFPGGFTLEAAEAVGPESEAGGGGGAVGESPTAPPPHRPSALDLVASLVEKSLVRYEPTAAGGPRYVLLETIREYAAERLADSGEEDLARHAFAAHALRVVEQNEVIASVPFQAEQLARLEAERVNLRATLSWLEGHGPTADFLRLVAALGWSWWVRGDVREGRIWLERALTRAATVPAAPAAQLAKVWLASGFLSLSASDYSRAGRELGEGLALLRALGDTHGLVQTLIGLGGAANYRGEHDRATVYLEEALTLARSLADERLSAVAVGNVLANLGVAAHGQRRLVQAAACHEEALRLKREVGSAFTVIHSLGDLGDLALDLGDVARAATCYREALTLAWSYGHTRVLAETIEDMASVLAATGQAERAGRLFGAGARLRQVTGSTDRTPVEQAAYERAMTAVRAALGADASAAAWETGLALPVDRAVEAALADVGPGESVPAGVTLSPRERDVLRLLVAGLTDRQIGEALFIGERTVESHVGRIYAKLGVRTRAAATATALAAGLVDPPTRPPSAQDT